METASEELLPRLDPAILDADVGQGPVRGQVQVSEDNQALANPWVLGGDEEGCESELTLEGGSPIS